MLLGQTLDGMQVWDVRRAIAALRSLPSTNSVSRDNMPRDNVPLTLCGRGPLGGVALYAALFEPEIAELVLEELPADHRHGPIFLNVSRYLEMPEAVAMVCQRSRVRLLKASKAPWAYPQAVVEKLGWNPEQLEILGL
jgi:hypothetical protein